MCAPLDDVAMRCADINEDGSINLSDIAELMVRISPAGR